MFKIQVTYRARISIRNTVEITRVLSEGGVFLLPKQLRDNGKRSTKVYKTVTGARKALVKFADHCFGVDENHSMEIVSALRS